VNIEDYQEAVQRTCATADRDDTLKLSLIGLQDELGEVAGPLKKYLWHGHTLDRDHIQDEMGDMMWYLATLCNALGITLEAALQGNVKKLQQRYPDGFSSERSVNRTKPTHTERSDECLRSHHVIE
jgi:NTP pyrophosphatase (non-canonical NTP hydrolase)